MELSPLTGNKSLKGYTPPPASLTVSRKWGSVQLGYFCGVNNVRVRDLSVCAWWSATASQGSGVSERFGGVERRKKDRAVPTHREATQLFRRDAEFKDSQHQHLPVHHLHSRCGAVAAVRSQWFLKRRHRNHSRYNYSCQQ